MPSTWENHGELSVRVHSYGPQRAVVFPGIVDSPDDWRMLARLSKKTLIVPRNPLHTGEKPYIEEWQSWWRKCMRKLVDEVACDEGWGHSAGCADLLSMAQGSRLNFIRLLNPPTKEIASLLGSKGSPLADTLDDHRMKMTDALLYPLCPDMPPARYQRLLKRHSSEYGSTLLSIFRHESPAKTGLPTEMAQMLASNAKVPMQLIVGDSDIWDLEPRRKNIFKGIENLETWVLHGGHLLHVEKPRKVSQLLHQ